MLACLTALSYQDIMMKRISLSRPLRLVFCCCAGATTGFPIRPTISSASRRRRFSSHSHHQAGTKLYERNSKKETQDFGSDGVLPLMNISALLGGIVQRADRTLSVLSEVRADSADSADLETPAAVRELLKDIGKEASPRNKQTVSKLASGSPETGRDSPVSPPPDRGDDDPINYGTNPTITMTALAHVLWKSIIRPGKDSAIDATAGNGGDATVLAKLLFPSQMVLTSESESSSHLACIDIQQAACEATQTVLSQVLSNEIIRERVTIKHGSHAPLTLPPSEAGPVAVVAYNLGYLPGQERSTGTTTTQSSTTLASLSEAVVCLRMGGLLSVLTYPQTNSLEDAAVQAFVEGLALFSSQSQDWRDFLIDADPVRYPILVDEAVRCEIRQHLHYVNEELGRRQCWRVHVHEKLGWLNAPRLLTATRVR